MNKHISFLILAITAVFFSGTMLRLFNDPEGPNLLIIGFFAAVFFAASLLANYFHSSNFAIVGYFRLIVAIVVQFIVATILYLFLK